MWFQTRKLTRTWERKVIFRGGSVFSKERVCLRKSEPILISMIEREDLNDYLGDFDLAGDFEREPTGDLWKKVNDWIIENVFCSRQKNKNSLYLEAERFSRFGERETERLRLRLRLRLLRSRGLLAKQNTNLKFVMLSEESTDWKWSL